MILSSSLAMGQIKTEDEAISVEQRISKSTYLKQKEMFPKLIFFYSKTSLEKALILSNQFIAVAKKENDKRAIADGLNLLGRTNIRMGNFAAAKQIHIDALFAYQALAHDTGVAAQYGNLGVIFEMSGDFPKAILFYQQALKIYKRLNDLKNIAVAENNIGIVYQQMNLFDQSFAYQQSAYLHKQQTNDTSGMASSLNNIGVIYESLKTDYDKALFYYHQSLKLYQQLGNSLQTGTLLNNIGLVYLKQDHLTEAETYLNQGFVIRKAMGDKSGEASSLLNLAQLAMKQNKYGVCIEKASTSISLFLMMGSKTKLSEAYQTLAQGYEKTNKQGLALDSYKKHIAYRDSVYNENNQKTIHEMQAKYDNEVAQKQLIILEKESKLKSEELSKNRWILLNITIIFLLMAGVYLFIVRQNKLKQLHKQSTIEHRLFRAQMNPHFIFNALASVQKFVMNNSKELGSAYITRFGRLMRKILENSTREFVPFSEEIGVLEDYIAFQQMRFNHKFTVDFIIDPNIEADLIEIPPMLIQPFIENSIEHGVAPIEFGKISIQFQLNQKQMLVTITDNGVGIDKSTKNHLPNHKSMAISIIKERLKLMAKTSHISPKITLKDLSKENPKQTGTEVVFEIPYR